MSSMTNRRPPVRLQNVFLTFRKKEQQLITRETIKALMCSKFGQIILPQTAELVALERLEKIPIDLQWEKMFMTTLALSF